MNDEAVYRTAPATPGLLNTNLYYTTQTNICFYDLGWYQRLHLNALNGSPNTNISQMFLQETQTELLSHLDIP